VPAAAGETNVMPIRTEEDVVRVRQTVRRNAVTLGFGLVDQTKLITASSELARNALIYGGGGEAVLEELREGGRTGIRVVFRDQGPGIADIEQAMRDGYTTGSGLGLGLSGSRRLVSEFDIRSAPGEGTRVTIVKWK
jgi:serine/threonine-protein kinase RsbT